MKKHLKTLLLKLGLVVQCGYQAGASWSYRMQSEMEDDIHPCWLCPHEQVMQPVDFQSKAIAAENLMSA